MERQDPGTALHLVAIAIAIAIWWRFRCFVVLIEVAGS